MASTTQIIQILIQSRAALGGINDAIKGVTGMTGALGGLTSHLRQSDQAAQGLASTLRTGVLYAVGDRLVSAFSVLPGLLRSATAEGVTFNSQMEVAQRSIAVALRANRPDLKSFDDAYKAADGLNKKLLQAANESSADYADLRMAYSTNIGLMFNAGIKDGDKQIKLLRLIGDAAKNAGLSGVQVLQETRALLTGDITPDATVASGLFASTSERKAYKEALAAGQGYDILMRKLAPVGEAAAVAGKHFDVMFSNFKSGLDLLKGNLFKPFFEELKRGLEMANKALASEDLPKRLAPLGDLLGKAAKAAVDLAGKLGQVDWGGFADRLSKMDWPTIAAGIAGVAAVLVVGKLAIPALAFGFAMAKCAFFARLMLSGLMAIPAMSGVWGTALAGMQAAARTLTLSISAMNAATVAVLAPLAILVGALAGVAAGLALREMTIGGRKVKDWAELAGLELAMMWEDFSANAQIAFTYAGTIAYAFGKLVTDNIGGAFRMLGDQIGDYMMLGFKKASKGIASWLQAGWLQGVLPDAVAKWRDETLSGDEITPIQTGIDKRNAQFAEGVVSAGWFADALDSARPDVRRIQEQRDENLKVLQEASALANRLTDAENDVPKAAEKKTPVASSGIQSALAAYAARQEKQAAEQAKLAAEKSRGWASQITAPNSASDRLARIGGFVGGAASGAQRESLNLQRAMVNLLREIRNNARKSGSLVLA